MFPNFTSLAQREQKRQELLEKAQRRVRQTNAKHQRYEGTMWASDAGKSIGIPNSSTSTTSQTESSGSFKKALIDEYSQTNPEFSSPNFRPVMVYSEVDAHPQTVDIGVNVSPQTVDIGSDATPDTVETGSNTKIRVELDTADQVGARIWIKNLFKANPNWTSLRVIPVKRKSGKDDKRYYLGDEGSLIAIKTGKKYYNYRTIDWVETEQKLRDIWYEGESKSIDEVSDMRLEDHDSLMKTRKWKVSNPSDRDDSNRIKQRLEDSFLFDNSTSTSNDQADAKIKLLWTISVNKEMLESNGLKKNIVPVLNETNKSSLVDRDEYVWIRGNSISVFGKESGLAKPAITKKVNWQSTLQSLVEMVKSRDFEILIIGKKDMEKNAQNFTPGDGKPRHGVLSGVGDMDTSLSNANYDAKTMLTEYYTLLETKHVKVPFRLSPVVDTQKGVKIHQSYFGEPMRDRVLNIRNNDHKPISGKVLVELMSRIRWMDTFTRQLNSFDDQGRYLKDKQYPFPKNDKQAADVRKEMKEDELRRQNLDENLKILNIAISKTSEDIIRQSAGQYDDRDERLQKLHDESEAAFIRYGEAEKRYEEAKRAVKSYNSKAARSALKAATSAMKATKAVFQIKTKTYYDAQNATISDIEAFASKQRLTGRGLMGAGVAPLDGVVRRGRTYNLNEIQGLATPSAYVCRQLGSKYIRIPDLDKKTLVIVQPNRRKCGPKLQISDSLQSMIKALAFKQHIDQVAYDKLSVDDKKVFKEILAITHLQYNFHDKLEDPLDSLRAEYDKLRGELELGNENPSIIKQLKSLSVDMYSTI